MLKLEDSCFRQMGSALGESPRVLVVDDEPDVCAMLHTMIAPRGFTVETATTPEAALARVSSFGPHVLLTDVQMPGTNGFTVMERALSIDPLLSVLFVTGQANVPDAVRAIRAGAEQYLLKPIDGDELMAALARSVARQQARRPATNGATEALLGVSEAMQSLRAQILRLGPRKATALVTGETGTGKERVAEALHAASPRARQPLVRVHCAALPETLLESELFGHERGAFTGAHTRRAGRFEQADGGTLLLDEIGEISPAIQVKLLRVLQEQRFERVGGNQTLAVDVRIIAATHRDLSAMVAAGTFREDLYYRLNVLELEVPPLRARRADIPILVEHALGRIARECGGARASVSDEAMAQLVRYDWPGNVRELENALERAYVLCDRGEITAGALSSRLRTATQRIGPPTVPGASFRQIERHAILTTYEECGQCVSRTAAVLGLSPRTIHYRLREYRGEPGRRQ
ncbi:MAG: sigma-54 dependent transcriptional regulator [Deltaproteobacteria bacterium]|nr:sigma-54 dependent transcriptional regulator [Myxococcales bacterium]MDP3218744.1 sigma-54 dependent transcriptional regulator [Deltaproteobacteria bacterium]